MVGTGKDVPVLKQHCGKVEVKQHKHTPPFSLSQH